MKRETSDAETYRRSAYSCHEEQEMQHEHSEMGRPAQEGKIVYQKRAKARRLIRHMRKSMRLAMSRRRPERPAH